MYPYDYDDYLKKKTTAFVFLNFLNRMGIPCARLWKTSVVQDFAKRH